MLPTHLVSRLFLFISFVSSSPIVHPPPDLNEIDVPVLPEEFCLLPPELNYQGEVTYLEDCEGLDRYDIVPLPADFRRKVGIHTRVCCPEKIEEGALCFPSDPWCPTYVKPDVNDYNDYYSADNYENDAAGSGSGDYIPIATDAPIYAAEIPKMSDSYCPDYNVPGHGVISECVPLANCPAILENDNAPVNQTQLCDFDENTNQIKICCPPAYVTASGTPVQAPRFPQPGGAPRPVEDRSPLCPRWRRGGGCRLDEDIKISELDPANGLVYSKVMFDFMVTACLDTCGWAGDKGCVDEHPRCPAWARGGMCIVAPFFMAHTCRESCGVCGFLSPFSTEEQVVGGQTYTDLTSDNFHCGEFKLLSEINGVPTKTGAGCVQETTKKPATEAEVDVFNYDSSDYSGDSDDFSAVDNEIGTDDLDLRSGDDVFFSFRAENAEDYYCGATIIADRWVLAAAHCYDDFGVAATEQAKEVKINTLRENTVHRETVEIKNVFKHPLYKYPKLYDDIALLELGRRVEYNYEKFGDSPSCVDQGNNNWANTIATVQGYGLTECGTKGTLLEANVTMITVDQCEEYYKYNTTNDKQDGLDAKKRVAAALPNGFRYGMLCAQGTQDEDGTFRGSCKGDSGGPLTTRVRDGLTTLVGIVSGGIGCGKGYPGWYTQVSFHMEWVNCIIQQSRLPGTNTKQVRSRCDEIAKAKQPACITQDDLIFDDFDDIELRGGDALPLC